MQSTLLRLILLLVVSAALGGCLGSSGVTDQDSPTHLLAGLSLRANCEAGIPAMAPTNLYCRGDELHFVGPLHLDAASSPSFQGIMIHDLHQDMLIRDIVIEGFTIGIQIQESSCDCTLRLVNVTILATDTGEPRDSIGLYWAQGSEQVSLEISGSRISSDASAVNVLGSSAISIEGTILKANATAFSSTATSNEVSIRESNLHANGIGVETYAAGQILLDSVTIAAPYGGALEADASITLNDVLVNAQSAGLSTRAQSVNVASSSFTVDGARPLQNTRDCPSSALCIESGVGTISSSSLLGAADYGLWAPIAPTTTLNVDANSNWWGDPRGPSTKLADGTVIVSGGSAVPAGLVVSSWLEGPPTHVSP